jgi:hypothetical protein
VASLPAVLHSLRAGTAKVRSEWCAKKNWTNNVVNEFDGRFQDFMNKSVKSDFSMSTGHGMQAAGAALVGYRG